MAALTDFMHLRQKSFNHSHLSWFLPLFLRLPLSPFLSSPQSLEIALKYCNYFFTSTFVLEAVLKLIAFGFRRFFKDRYLLCSPLLRYFLHVSSRLLLSALSLTLPFSCSYFSSCLLFRDLVFCLLSSPHLFSLLPSRTSSSSRFHFFWISV